MIAVKGSLIELETFDDLIYFVFSRITTVNPNASVLCSSSRCFTIISGGNEHLFVIASPPPAKQCRFAYVDENGKIRCSDTPIPGKPMVIIVSVKRSEKIEDVTIFLKEFVEK